MDSSLPIVDKEILEELREFCDRETLGRLISTFITLTQEQLECASVALEAGDLWRVEQAVHTMRSGIGSLGAMRMAPLATSIEALAHEGEDSQLRQKLQALEREFAEFRERICVWHRELSHPEFEPPT